MEDTSLLNFFDDAEPKMNVPALKGTLGGVDYFVITLKYGVLPRYISSTDPNITDPRQRENRKASPNRFKAIADYILGYPDGYRFSALTCTYGKKDTEKPVDWKSVPNTGDSIGLLTLNQNDPLVIVDGQHRLGAIKEAIERKDADPSLRDESIPIVLFPYLSIEHAQQLFSDLNRNAHKTTKSLDILFDHRDPDNQIAQQLVERVSFFGDTVNIEAVSVPQKSSEMFTLAGIYQATKPVVRAFGEAGLLPDLSETTMEKYVEALTEFWEGLGSYFPEWKKVASHEEDIQKIRSTYIHWNSGVLSAIGEFAGFLITNYTDDWTDLLERAVTSPSNDSWRRESQHWQGIATAGRLVLPRSALRAQMLVYLKREAELDLTAEEERVLTDKGKAAQPATVLG